MRDILIAEEPLEPRNADLETGDTDVFDETIALVRLDGDRRLLLQVIHAFTEECPSHLRRMRAALQSGELQGMMDEARKLKEEAANVGGKNTEKAAAELAKSAESGDPVATRKSFQIVEKEVGRLWSALEEHLKTSGG